MGERKVLNKYYPPDFDPAKLPRGQRGNKDAQMKVRMMLPMSIRCSTCGTYMYKGTKFNMRMENVEGEDYLGLRIFRFYARCTSCAAEYTMKTDPQNSDYTMERGATCNFEPWREKDKAKIKHRKPGADCCAAEYTMKTDPQNSDYTMERGATRNFEPWREKDKAKIEAAKEREAEEAGNAMKALENRTLDSKREMDIMSALDELKSVNARHEGISTEAAIAAIKRSAEGDGEGGVDLTPEDEEAVQNMILQRTNFVKRLEDPDDLANAAGGSGSGATAAAAGPGPSSLAAIELQSDTAKAGAAPPKQAKPAAAFAVRPRQVQVVVKRKAPASAANGGSSSDANGSAAANDGPPAKKQEVAKGSESPSGDALLGLGGYGSSSSSE
ncbi:hypothetical protein WJX72_007581 [[Myrmecia] bisecta]|uniref:Splicing factor YJU2 n=1 Tax=[Myrmecia] bisecta TaxID=41462 RepID=A0AAW1PAW8_9CHLO